MALLYQAATKSHMTTEEQKTQIIRTPDQWNSGLLLRLNVGKDGGISLFSMPAFDSWVKGLPAVKNIRGIAFDSCGLLYFVNEQMRSLCVFDLRSQISESILSGEFKGCIRILLDDLTLWVVDKKGVRAFSRQNYQIKHALVEKGIEPCDIAIEAASYVYILDKNSKRILKYSISGRYLESFGESLKEPIALSVGKDNNLYVIDRQCTGFIRFRLNQKPECGKFPENFLPTTLTIDQDGTIFAGDESGMICQFD